MDFGECCPRSHPVTLTPYLHSEGESPLVFRYYPCREIGASCNTSGVRHRMRPAGDCLTAPIVHAQRSKIAQKWETQAFADRG